MTNSWIRFYRIWVLQNLKLKSCAFLLAALIICGQEACRVVFEPHACCQYDWCVEMKSLKVLGHPQPRTLIEVASKTNIVFCPCQDDKKKQLVKQKVSVKASEIPQINQITILWDALTILTSLSCYPVANRFGPQRLRSARGSCPRALDGSVDAKRSSLCASSFESPAEQWPSQTREGVARHERDKSERPSQSSKGPVEQIFCSEKSLLTDLVVRFIRSQKHPISYSEPPLTSGLQQLLIEFQIQHPGPWSHNQRGGDLIQSRPGSHPVLIWPSKWACLPKKQQCNQ